MGNLFMTLFLKKSTLQMVENSARTKTKYTERLKEQIRVISCDLKLGYITARTEKKN